jgi:Fe(3+) dicitrate transport protein
MKFRINILRFLTHVAFIPAGLYTQNDSLKVNLSEIEIKEELGGMKRMPDLRDHIIFAGKKTEVIRLDKINADLSINNTRQVFAKVPGVSVWENDGSGIQVGVATRGLSPNRSWEFNVRQNGYDISSEIFGYPEAYYNPPMEAVEEIQVIRGAASLQFGPQFGGLLNYNLKKGNPEKPISFETQQTVGSYGLFNTFNAIGGTHKKISYYGFFQYRTADGWRQNSRYNTYTGYVSINYRITEKINLGAEYTKMEYVSQQPGGLTDLQFEQNHRQSFRERNWFNAPWNLASLNFKYDISSAISLNLKSFATISERNSVGFLKAINIKDTINPSTLEYASRQVDRDSYKNFGTEARLTVKYKFFGKENVLASGFRAYRGNTLRNQLGVGTSGMDFDLKLTQPQYGRALEFTTDNLAFFAEHIFYVGNRLKVVPGFRFENIQNGMSGYINTSPTGILEPFKRNRQFFLYGVGIEFVTSKTTRIYGNYSTAFRPITFSELTPSATTEIIDPNLKDASGFNADFGFRGTIRNFLNFDIGVFYLNYDNRIGTISRDGVPFRTNIGTSVSKGLESYVELDVVKLFTQNSKFGGMSLFASNALLDARYVKWNNPAISSDPSKSIEGKRVENAPEYIHRFGLTYSLKDFSISWQISSVGSVFTDAANTTAPNAAGTIGKLSGYEVMDLSMTFKFLERYNFKAGINNLTDEKYATRRAGGYPGPGILPGNGRTFFISLGAKF